MSSDSAPERLDLARDLPTTPADVEAHRRAPMPRLTFDQYLAFLSALGAPPNEALRRRRLPVGVPPFRLTD